MINDIRESEPREFAYVEGRVIALEIATSLYSSPAILRACYKFADRLYSFVSYAETDTVLVVALWSRTGGEISPSLVGEFCSELTDQELRERLARETGPLREMVVAQAFAEGDLPGEFYDSDYEADPLGLAKT
jgi:His-Xaa-Ser system protein HxsD